jgi:hypothetical protein
VSKAAFKRMMRQRSAAPLLRPARAECARLTGEVTAADHYIPPTDEQLANFVAAMVKAAAETDGLSCRLTPWVAGMMLRADDAAKAGWVRRHREFQEAVENRLQRGESAL